MYKHTNTHVFALAHAHTHNNTYMLHWHPHINMCIHICKFNYRHLSHVRRAIFMCDRSKSNQNSQHMRSTPYQPATSAQGSYFFCWRVSPHVTLWEHKTLNPEPWTLIDLNHKSLISLKHQTARDTLFTRNKLKHEVFFVHEKRPKYAHTCGKKICYRMSVYWRRLYKMYMYYIYRGRGERECARNRESARKRERERCIDISAHVHEYIYMTTWYCAESFCVCWFWTSQEHHQVKEMENRKAWMAMILQMWHVVIRSHFGILFFTVCRPLFHKYTCPIRSCQMFQLCMCACVYVYICLCMCACVWYVWVCMCVYICVCVCVCVCVNACVSSLVCLSLRVCDGVCIIEQRRLFQPQNRTLLPACSRETQPGSLQTLFPFPWLPHIFFPPRRVHISCFLVCMWTFVETCAEVIGSDRWWICVKSSRPSAAELLSRGFLSFRP